MFVITWLLLRRKCKLFVDNFRRRAGLSIEADISTLEQITAVAITTSEHMSRSVFVVDHVICCRRRNEWNGETCCSYMRYQKPNLYVCEKGADKPTVVHAISRKVTVNKERHLSSKMWSLKVSAKKNHIASTIVKWKQFVRSFTGPWLNFIYWTRHISAWTAEDNRKFVLEIRWYPFQFSFNEIKQIL